MRISRITGLCLLAACHPVASTSVQPNTSFSLLGGAHSERGDDLVLNDAGSGIGLTFVGTGVEFDLNNSQPGGQTYYQIVIDSTVTKIVQLDSTANRYTFEGLPAGVHNLLVRRLNGVHFGEGHLTDLTLVQDGYFVPGDAPRRRIEFVGDELMSGWGLEDMDDAFGWTTNAALSVAGQTAKGLQADYRVREVEDWLPAQHWVPHVVVLQFDDHDLTTVQKIRTAYPQARIVLMIPPQVHDDTLAQARALGADTGLRTLEFVHPDTRRSDSYGHFAMARELRSLLCDVMNWHDGISVAASQHALF